MNELKRASENMLISDILERPLLYRHEQLKIEKRGGPTLEGLGGIRGGILEGSWSVN